jgi:arabinose-5-phosphate isomerase
MSDSGALVEQGRRVIRLERGALERMECRLDESFARAVEMIATSGGGVIVAGVGKSGLVGRKIAATLTSTGTPASFLHPVESIHGDLGIVGPQDVAILLSKSGETGELFPLLEQLRRLGVQIVAITGATDSTLARHADAVLDTSVDEEACPFDHAPTSSTPAARAMGDALAVTLIERKGFRPEDFARLHPGGSLGKKLLIRVSDVMVTDPLPTLEQSATMRDAVVLLAERRGTVAILDGERRVQGVVTAGDLTRLMERVGDVFAVKVESVMNRTPKLAHVDELGSAVVYRMEQFKVMAMPVLDDDQRMVGIIHLHDLMRAGAA